MDGNGNMVARRSLGKTGFQVSAVALGTVSLGVDYGIEAPGEFGRPSEADAIWLLRQAADAGINLFDTAPAYGEGERLLGQALRSHPGCYIATKVPVPIGANGSPMRDTPLRRAVQISLENSLRALQRDVLDIVQIHNATVDIIIQGEMADTLLDARHQGKVRSLPEAALRFCLSAPQVATVLVGARTPEELRQALTAAASGPLSEELLARTPALALEDERVLNPSYWPVA